MAQLESAHSRPKRYNGRPRPCFPFALAVLFLTLACNVGQRQQQQRPSTIPEEAQATIDRVTADIEAGRDEKIYSEAAEEWRRSSTPEQSKAIFELLRLKLGKLKERARQTVHDEQKTGGAQPLHRLVIRYDAKFERADGMETFTLVERDGRWLLAGYLVNSDALK
ncbi:MAG TPA: DUF4019 domain-containing protein [Pyrinomonadaceae bacterium]|jgi:hypothetical protein|nr:DUF4019 domain-containing protein [Pyrinomonadaceae bacterium]